MNIRIINKMKSLRMIGIGLLAVIPFLTMKAQKALTPQELEAWKRITTRVISDDGQWAAAVFLSFLPKMLYYCIQIIASYNDNQF